MKSRYKRVVVKTSGKALAGSGDFGIEATAIEHVASEIIGLHRLGIQVAVMVGGGNIFRGSTADMWGIDRVEADNVGMIGTVINSLILRGVLTARGVADIRVMTAIPMPSIAEPYIRLRAIHHLEKSSIVIFGAGTGQPFVTTDYPAVQRALEIKADAILVGKHGVDGVYSDDPNLSTDVEKFERLDYDTALRMGINVMDQAAFLLARDHRLPIHIFDLSTKGLMAEICRGTNHGTVITQSK